MQDCELLLEELDAVVCDCLGHLEVEVLVKKRLVRGELFPQLVAELFSQLLRHQRYIDQLFGLSDFLLEFELEAHVDF